MTREWLGHLGLALIVTFESVFVTELRHAEYLRTGALEDSALAMAIPPPTSATATAVVTAILQSFIMYLPVSVDVRHQDVLVTNCHVIYRRDYSYEVSNATGAERKLVRSTRPSSLPSSVDIARSGCGMRPTTLPRSLAMPAMSPREPFGLSW